MRKILLAIVSVSLLGLSGCAHFGIYRPDIEQGNVVTTQQVDKLHKGQTKTQVQQIMGGAVLEDAFDENRWTYVYTYQHDGGKIYQKNVVINFKNGLVTSVEKNIPAEMHPNAR